LKIKLWKDKWTKKSRIPFKSIAYGIILLLLITMLIAAIMPGQPRRQMSIYNDEWNDLSKFRDELVKQGYKTKNIMASPSTLNRYWLSQGANFTWADTLIMVIGVEKPYTKAEALSLLEYTYYDEARILVADDFGYGNDLFEKMEISAQVVSGARLYSEDYEKNPAFVKAKATIENHEYDIMLNKPSTINAELGGPFIKSDAQSWLDVNDNQDKDLNETEDIHYMGNFFSGHWGAVLSDPSIFINDMFDRAQNRAFILALVRHLLPNGGTVIFDESRHASKDPVSEARSNIYDGIMFVVTNYYAAGALVLFCLAGCVLYLIKMKLPEEWFHTDVLLKPNLREYEEPELSRTDHIRLRFILQNKLRIAMGLSEEEFSKVRKDQIEQVVTDPDLFKFLYLKHGYTKEELEYIMEKMKDFDMKHITMDLFREVV
jgi:hypothetical protein